MNKKLIPCFVSLAITAGFSYANSASDVFDEASLHQAVYNASLDSSISRIVFAPGVEIFLSAPVVYFGTQSLKLVGNGAIIDGSGAGSFTLDDDLTAITTDGSLVFNTEGDISIRNLTIRDSATRGIVVNIPVDASGDDIQVSLHRVNVVGSALFGLHVDDNDSEFDDGETGSSVGIYLSMSFSNFVGNGTGAIDFDGVRVDERGEGSIEAVLFHTHIDGNGGDGMELDEAGEGDVSASLFHVSLNNNGFYNEEDLDDGFDIDEAGEGDVNVSLFAVQANGNMDEGLDFDEEGDGNVIAKLRRVVARNNSDEAFKIDEEGGGDIRVALKRVKIVNSGDDGIQFTELGEGRIDASMVGVRVVNNAKYGIKIEQWVEEDEETPQELAGTLTLRNSTLASNGKGDEPKLNNIVLNKNRDRHI